MDRRDWLKWLGLGWLGGAAVGDAHGVAPLQEAGPWQAGMVGRGMGYVEFLAKHQERMDRLIADADQFLADCREVEPDFLNTCAVSLPATVVPPAVYARAPRGLREKVPAPRSLQEMAADVRGSRLEITQPCLHDVLHELWKRHDPGLYRTRPDVPTRPEMLAQRRPAPERIATPRFTVDTLDLDAHALLVILQGPRMLADELRAHTRRAVALIQESPLQDGPLEGDGWQGPMEVFVKHEAYLIEVICCLVCGGEGGACTTTPTTPTVTTTPATPAAALPGRPMA